MEISDLHLLLKHTLIFLGFFSLDDLRLYGDRSRCLYFQKHINLTQSTFLSSNHILPNDKLPLLNNLSSLYNRIRDIPNITPIKCSIHKYENPIMIFLIFFEDNLTFLKINKLSLRNNLNNFINLYNLINFRLIQNIDYRIISYHIS